MGRYQVEERVILVESNWKIIPGYEGVYWIDRAGRVKNADGHVLQTAPSKEGLRVELRKNGQRERILVSELIQASGWLK